MKKNNTRDSNVVPHRSTNQARRCLTSLSRREAVLSSWYVWSFLPGRVILTYKFLPFNFSCFASTGSQSG